MSKLLFFFFSLIFFSTIIYTNHEKVSQFLLSIQLPISEDEPNAYVWKIEDFSSLKRETLSEVFSAHGVNWRLSMYPQGTHLGIYLGSLDTTAWFTQFSFAVINYKNPAHTVKFGAECELLITNLPMGCNQVMRMTELVDPKKGFVTNDTLYIKVEILSKIKIIKSSPALTGDKDLPAPKKAASQSDDLKLKLLKGKEGVSREIFRLFQSLWGFVNTQRSRVRGIIESYFF